MRHAFSGKYLHKKQKISLSFAGRNLSIIFEEINLAKNLTEKLENLSIHEEIFLVNHESIFYTDTENSTKTDLKCISTDFLNSIIVENIQRQLLQTLLNFKNFPVKPTKGYIIHGQSGTGKTEFINFIKSQLFNTNISYLDVKTDKDLEKINISAQSDLLVILDRKGLI